MSQRHRTFTMNTEHGVVPDGREPSLINLYRRLIPDWTALAHKGGAGRVAVVGGCLEYTGAPYFAAMAATYTGADLAYVFCEQSAAIPIKAHAADLIVIPTMHASEARIPATNQREGPVDRVLVEQADAPPPPTSLPAETDDAYAVHIFGQWLPRLHAVAFGPGLGRDPRVLGAVQHMLAMAVEQRVPIIIDADALYLLGVAGRAGDDTRLSRALAARRQRESAHGGAATTAAAPLVLTPNAVEGNRLLHSFQSAAVERLLEEVLTAADLVVEKGTLDRLHFCATDARYPSPLLCSERGSPRRCGGQGDVLCGALLTSMAWAHRCLDESVRRHPHRYLAAAHGACRLTRIAARMAFAERYRATVASDVLAQVGPAFRTLECEPATPPTRVVQAGTFADASDEQR
eukprot:ctg_5535.g649